MAIANDENWHGGILLYTALLIMSIVERANRNGGLDLNRRISYVGLHGKWSACQRFFSFPRCGGRCFLLIYHKHKLQMLHKCPRCLWFRQKNRLNCYKARTFQKFLWKMAKKAGQHTPPRRSHTVIPLTAFVQSEIVFSVCGLSKQTRSAPFRTIPEWTGPFSKPEIDKALPFRQKHLH